MEIISLIIIALVVLIVVLFNIRLQGTAKKILLAIQITLSPFALFLIMSTTTNITNFHAELDLAIYAIPGTILTAIIGALISWSNNRVSLKGFIIPAAIIILIELFFIFNPLSYQSISW